MRAGTKLGFNPPVNLCANPIDQTLGYSIIVGATQFAMRRRSSGDQRGWSPAQLAAGTTTVPVAVTTTIGSARTEAAESPRDGSARQTTRASKASCLLRRPTAVTVAVASMTSPARTGARNCTSEYDANKLSSPSIRMAASVATSPNSPST